MTASIRHKALSSTALPSATLNRNRRSSPQAQQRIRTPVRHLTLPYFETARIDMREGETINALVKRSGWATWVDRRWLGGRCAGYGVRPSWPRFGAYRCDGFRWRAPDRSSTMTAINILLQRGAVHLCSDGAVIDPASGMLIHAAPKVFPLPHVNAVVAFQGTVAGMVLLGEFMATARSWIDLKAKAVDYVREGVAALDNAQVARDNAMRIFVAGVDAGMAEAFVVLSSPDSGLPAGELLPIEDLSVTPADGQLHASLVELIAGRSVDQFDPALDMLAVIDLQRCRAWPDARQRLRHSVGGFAQLTSITENGIHTRGSCGVGMIRSASRSRRLVTR